MTTEAEAEVETGAAASPASESDAAALPKQQSSDEYKQHHGHSSSSAIIEANIEETSAEKTPPLQSRPSRVVVEEWRTLVFDEEEQEDAENKGIDINMAASVLGGGERSDLLPMANKWRFLPALNFLDLFPLLRPEQPSPPHAPVPSKSRARPPPTTVTTATVRFRASTRFLYGAAVVATVLIASDKIVSWMMMGHLPSAIADAGGRAEMKETPTMTPVASEAQIEKGSFHTTHNFTFNNRVFLDAFVTPPLYDDRHTGTGTGTGTGTAYDGPSSGIVYAAMVSFDLGKENPSASCHFSLSWSSSFGSTNTLSSPLVSKRGAEGHHYTIYHCRVPQAVLDQVPEKDDGNERNDHLVLTVQKDDGSESVQIMAALWPYRNRNVRYRVAVTNMNRNVECGKGNPESTCFHDWILWHRNYGVEHFFIYDNLSRKDHPWLTAARSYMDQGILTLIDWPYHLGGPDNNMAQGVSMNHAMFAVAGRVTWLGYFDVDEFFFVQDSPKLQEEDDNNEESSSNHTSQHKGVLAFPYPPVGDLLDNLAHTVSTGNDTSSLTVAIQVAMRNAQHPDYCHDNRNATEDGAADGANFNFSQRTTRLSRCTTYRSAVPYNGHKKIFVRPRTGHLGPRHIDHPHGMQGEGVVMVSPPASSYDGRMHFVHFAKKYGCKSMEAKGCIPFDDVAMSPEVTLLEQQLAPLFVDDQQSKILKLANNNSRRV